LAAYVSGAKADALPAAVRKEAARTFLNWLGCAIGGSQHEATDIAIAAMSPFAGSAQATILGRRERMDILHAALINGISSHVFDFDDTHLRTVIHPAGPVASALLAFAEYRQVSGRDFLNALVLGIETECRIGNAVFPAHYDIGWHITGSTGVFGAAAAIGKLLHLDERRMAAALGLAATQPVGLREMFGTMTKSFHPGRAAQNGMTAALLAEKGYTSSEQAIEANRGWARVTSTMQDWGAIVDGLGASYEILLNTYKPFACGIVIHPAIDGCIQLRNEYGLQADQISAVSLDVHPLVLELTGKKTPGTGLDGKFSVYHSVAVAIIDGAAGEAQYSDAAVRAPETIKLRDKVSAHIDQNLESDAARITISLSDGRTLHKYVEHAIGSVARPMSDVELETKFLGLTENIPIASDPRHLIDLCWTLETLDDVGQIARAGAG
jgi:2-methylcitrate dehydratase PrpD